MNDHDTQLSRVAERCRKLANENRQMKMKIDDLALEQAADEIRKARKEADQARREVADWKRAMASGRSVVQVISDDEAIAKAVAPYQKENAALRASRDEWNAWRTEWQRERVERELRKARRKIRKKKKKKAKAVAPTHQDPANDSDNAPQGVPDKIGFAYEGPGKGFYSAPEPDQCRCRKDGSYHRIMSGCPGF